VSQALQRLAGATVVLATVTSNAAMTETLGGLAPRGELIVVGLDPTPLEVSTLGLVGGEQKIYGHASGTSREIEETLHFAGLTGIRPLIEEAPLTEAQSALERMSSGQARFRMILTTGR